MCNHKPLLLIAEPTRIDHCLDLCGWTIVSLPCSSKSKRSYHTREIRLPLIIYFKRRRVQPTRPLSFNERGRGIHSKRKERVRGREWQHETAAIVVTKVSAPIDCILILKSGEHGSYISGRSVTSAKIRLYAVIILVCKKCDWLELHVTLDSGLSCLGRSRKVLINLEFKISAETLTGHIHWS